jgi:hypothetical protein
MCQKKDILHRLFVVLNRSSGSAVPYVASIQKPRPTTVPIVESLIRENRFMTKKEIDLFGLAPNKQGERLTAVEMQISDSWLRGR